MKNENSSVDRKNKDMSEWTLEEISEELEEVQNEWDRLWDEYCKEKQKLLDRKDMLRELYSNKKYSHY